MFAITDAPIDVASVRQAVDDPGFGAILVFEGVGRDHFDGRKVIHLAYEVFAEMAVPVLQSIATEAMARWPGVRLAMIHRTGIVAIGEPSVVIAVGAPHRAACYEASRFAIDALKERLPAWKKEVYEDGSAWKANAAQDAGKP